MKIIRLPFSSRRILDAESHRSLLRDLAKECRGQIGKFGSSATIDVALRGQWFARSSRRVLGVIGFVVDELNGDDHGFVVVRFSAGELAERIESKLSNLPKSSSSTENPATMASTKKVHRGKRKRRTFHEYPDNHKIATTVQNLRKSKIVDMAKAAFDRDGHSATIDIRMSGPWISHDFRTVSGVRGDIIRSVDNGDNVVARFRALDFLDIDELPSQNENRL